MYDIYAYTPRGQSWHKGSYSTVIHPCFLRRRSFIEPEARLFNYTSWPVSSRVLPVSPPPPSQCWDSAVHCHFWGIQTQLSCWICISSTSYRVISPAPLGHIGSFPSLESCRASLHPFGGTSPTLSVTISDWHHLLATKTAMSPRRAHPQGTTVEGQVRVLKPGDSSQSWNQSDVEGHNLPSHLSYIASLEPQVLCLTSHFLPQPSMCLHLYSHHSDQRE